MMNDNELQVGNHDTDDSDNTMAVLNTLGGGEQEPEGQPLGLDPDAGRSKLSGSTLAVGAVVLVGVGALFAMKMTLKAEATDQGTADAILEIDKFINDITAAEAAGAQTPMIAQLDGESDKIINELRSDPTRHQVPADQVEKNPFELVGLAVAPPPLPPPDEDPVEIERRQLENYQAIARDFEIGGINGNIVFINGNMLRVGDEIGDTGFTIAEVDGLDVVVRVPEDAMKPWAFRLHYE